MISGLLTLAPNTVLEQAVESPLNFIHYLSIVFASILMRLRCTPSMLRLADISAVRLPPKVAAPIYSTAAFKAWRTAVIERANNRCEWKGCGVMGSPMVTGSRMFADHIVELKDGGAPFDPANGQCLCGKHHSLKTIAERSKRLARG